MNRPALVFRDVTVHYESSGEAAISGVSFSIAAGERVALVGLNGSGKSTLLLAAVGLVPFQGEIWVSGTLVSRRTVAEIRERIGFLFNVPEDQLLFSKAVEDTAFGLLRRGYASQEAFAKATRVLDSLGVGRFAESPLHHLSHGQKQRVALAGAIVTDPQLLLLDEPSAGLDPPGKQALVRLLPGLKAAMLVATHDLSFGASFCSRFIMLERGRIVFDGTDEATIRKRWQIADPVQML
ncbi:MAG: ABC transporter ATP-binding protein [bacterium]|nr:ABC transporter ATP-binding protein [bacterium]